MSKRVVLACVVTVVLVATAVVVPLVLGSSSLAPPVKLTAPSGPPPSARLCNGGPASGLLNGPASAPATYNSGTTYTYSATAPVFVTNGSPANLYQFLGPTGAGLTPPTTAVSNSHWQYVNTASGGIVTVPAGDNSSVTMSSGGLITNNFAVLPNTVYFLDTGTHTLGNHNYGQIDPSTGDTMLGQTGAVLNGDGGTASPVNQFAFTNNTSSVNMPSGGPSTNVVIEYLTIQDFDPGTDAAAVNGGVPQANWTAQNNIMTDNVGAAIDLGTNSVTSENCLSYNDQYGVTAATGSLSISISNITLTNNDIAYNDTNGTYDQNANISSYSVASGSPNTATINLSSPINMQVGHAVNVGTTGTSCNFPWCKNLTNSGLNGVQTIATASQGAFCNAVSAYLCTTFTFTYTGSVGSSCASSCAGTISDSNIQEGAAGGGKFYDASGGATITGNWVHGNGYAGIWPDTNNAGFNISNNYINNNWAEGVLYEVSYNTQIVNNTFVDNAWGYGPSPALGGFPGSAVYISESGAATLASPASNSYNTALNITNNSFTDNWGGVVIYENSNRACGLSNDELCTLTTPSTYTLSSCAANIPNGSTGTAPDYVDNCRWKSQYVNVANNAFNFTPQNIGPDCTAANTCGYNGLFSEPGTTPSPVYNGSAASSTAGGTTISGITSLTVGNTAYYATSGQLYVPSTTSGGVTILAYSAVASGTTFTISSCVSGCTGSTVSGTVYQQWPVGASYPYTGYSVPNNISNNQHNSFVNNTYCASAGKAWSFVGFVQGNSMTKAQWLAGESNIDGSGLGIPAMDAGSVFNSGSCTSYTPPPCKYRVRGRLCGGQALSVLHQPTRASRSQDRVRRIPA